MNIQLKCAFKSHMVTYDKLVDLEAESSMLLEKDNFPCTAKDKSQVYWDSSISALRTCESKGTCTNKKKQ